MFASVSLAIQIESAEASMSHDLAHAVRGNSAGEMSFAQPLAGGNAVYCRPGSPLNKVIGAALAEPLVAAELVKLEGLYDERKEPTRFELCTLALPETGKLLTERGYRLLGFENVLGRKLAAASPAPEPPGITVQRIAGGSLEQWRQVLVEGFVHSDESGLVVDSFSRGILEDAVFDTTLAPGYDHYLAHLEGKAAGAASMRVHGPVALLTGAATLPPFRKRGVQAALLARRLADAAEKGAKLAVITTGGATRSQANAMRKGFALLYARAILAKSPQ